MAKIKDLTGQRFNRLVVLYRLPKRAHNGFLWLCRCDCGNMRAISTADLTMGHVKSCGCLKHRVKDYTGERHGHLTAIRPTGRLDAGGHRIYLWQCDCGRLVERSVCGINDKHRGYMCQECRQTLNRRQANAMREKRRIDPETGASVKAVQDIVNGVVTAANKSGVRGVYWHEAKKKWIATGRADGKALELGAFDSLSDAKKERERFVDRVYGRSKE